LRSALEAAASFQGVAVVDVATDAELITPSARLSELMGSSAARFEAFSNGDPRSVPEASDPEGARRR
jgi:hypothetical protein